MDGRKLVKIGLNTGGADKSLARPDWKIIEK